MRATLKVVGRGLGLLLAFALCAGAALAQQQSGASLRGQVSDEFGGVIVGAAVTVTDASGKARTTVTDSDGAFTVAGLMPGRYGVRIFSAGFAPFEEAGVEVAAGRNELPKVTLGVSLEKEEVTVASEGPLSLDNANSGAIVLKGKDLEVLPEDAEDLSAALAALAGPAAGPNGGQITIDGFEGGIMPSRDSIREVRVSENPFTAERDAPGFGSIQVFTKPGTEKLRGNFGVTFNDESLNSRNPFLRSEKRPPFQFRQYSGNLSGTFVPKKSSFFFDFNRGETDDNDLVNGFVLDDVTGSPVPFNLAVLSPRRSLQFSARVDYAFNDSHTLVARYVHFRTEDKNFGVSQYSLPGRAYDQTLGSHNLQLTHTAVVNRTTVNETRFQLLRNRNQQFALNHGVAINVFDAFSSGGATVGDSFNNTMRWDVTNTTTRVHGRHTVRFGARVRGIRLSDFSENNFNGTYTFSSLEQYRAALGGQGFATQFSVSEGEPLAEFSQLDFGGFVLDDWKVRPNLTVGAGLRYERQSNINSNLGFAPRVYVAWSPDGGGGRQAKTVVRVGFGLFYDRVSENYGLQALRFNGVNQQQFIVTAPFSDEQIRALGLGAEQTAAELARAAAARALLSNFPAAPTSEQLSAFRLSQTTRLLDPDATAAQSYVIGAIFTRQLTKTTTFNAFFATTAAVRHLPRMRNINAPLPSGLRPRPEVGNIFQIETSANMNFKQLNLSVSKQFSRTFSVTAHYMPGKAESDADFGGFPVNQYDLTGEYGRTSFDQRHRFTLFGTMVVPFLKLSLNPIVIGNTGRPFNIITGVDNNRDGVINDRPAFADAQTTAADLRSTPWGDFDINPKPGQTIVPRNYGQAPGFFSVNLRVGRTFGFGELPGAAARRRQVAAQPGGAGQQRVAAAPANRGGGAAPTAGTPRPSGPSMATMTAGGGGGEQKRYTLNFSLNFINLLNRTNLGQPVGNLRSPNFGESLSSVGGFGNTGGNQAAGNRRVQASVRFSF